MKLKRLFQPSNLTVLDGRCFNEEKTWLMVKREEVMRWHFTGSRSWQALERMPHIELNPIWKKGYAYASDARNNN